jgi:hypothetical protein
METNTVRSIVANLNSRIIREEFSEAQMNTALNFITFLVTNYQNNDIEINGYLAFRSFVSEVNDAGFFPVNIGFGN